MKSNLVFFTSKSSPQRRRRRWVFVAIASAIAAMILWPVYPVFGGIRPLILGLPLSFIWIIFALLLMFFALLWLYRADQADGEE